MGNRGLLILASLILLSGCEEHAYRVTQEVSPYVKKNMESLSRLADLISGEPEIGEVWCVPPATVEARNKGGGDWYELDGDRFKVYSEQCVAAQVEGAYIEDDNPVIVLQFIMAGNAALRFELVRPTNEEGKKQTCGLMSFLPSIERCQMRVDSDGWVVRYTALTDEELARLRQSAE